MDLKTRRSSDLGSATMPSAGIDAGDQVELPIEAIDLPDAEGGEGGKEER
jgi:hypothetical protein